MEGIEKIFNPKKTIFLGMDDQGRIQGRGRFFGELKPEQLPTIKSTYLSGFKKKNLIELVDLFPNLVELTIEKTSNLVSLEGVNLLLGLRAITIEDCPKLMDLSALISCTQLAKVNLEAFKNEAKVLDYISPKTVKDLSLHGNLIDLEKVINFQELEYLSLNGHDCNIASLPTLPKVAKNFNLRGFPNLTNASFMENFNANMRITWWGPKPIEGIPEQLKDFKTFL